MRHILPSTVAKLTEEVFDSITKIPVCSILIRFLPHSEVGFVLVVTKFRQYSVKT